MANDSKPMKHYILGLLTIVLISCNQTPSMDSMIVTGQVKGLKKGTYNIIKCNDVPKIDKLIY